MGDRAVTYAEMLDELKNWPLVEYYKSANLEDPTVQRAVTQAYNALLNGTLKADKRSSNLLGGLPHFDGAEWQYQNRTENDIETERMQRLTDRLNARIMHQYQNSGMTADGGYRTGTNDSQYKMPKLETEDTRLQNLRRPYENNRRTWNTGLAQKQQQYQEAFKQQVTMESFINRMKQGEIATQLAKGISAADPLGLTYFLNFISIGELDKNVYDKLFKFLQSIVVDQPLYGTGGEPVER